MALDIGCSKTKTSKAVLLQITCFFGGKTVSTRLFRWIAGVSSPLLGEHASQKNVIYLEQKNELITLQSRLH